MLFSMFPIKKSRAKPTNNETLFGHHHLSQSIETRQPSEWLAKLFPFTPSVIIVIIIASSAGYLLTLCINHLTVFCSILFIYVVLFIRSLICLHLWFRTHAHHFDHFCTYRVYIQAVECSVVCFFVRSFGNFILMGKHLFASFYELYTHTPNSVSVCVSGNDCCKGFSVAFSFRNNSIISEFGLSLAWVWLEFARLNSKKWNSQYTHSHICTYKHSNALADPCWLAFFFLSHAFIQCIIK